VAGGGDTAVDSALALGNTVDEFTLIHRKEAFRAYEVNVKKAFDSEKIQILLETEIEEILGSENVERLKILDKEGESAEIVADAVILAFGQVPNNEIFAKLGLKLDHEGKIVTDSRQKTNLEGIYAIGDIVAGTGNLELIVVAVAQGAIAAHHSYLETASPYWG
jgi:thioredoxin reductase (NADPH)